MATSTGAEPLVLRPLGDGGARLLGAAGQADQAPVWLEEETGYPVLLQSLDGRPVALVHRDPVVTAGLVAVDEGRVVHGRIRFGSQAGRTRVVLWAGGVPEAEVEVSILPRKLSEAEVEAMRASVEAAAAGLAVSGLRPATRAVGHGEARPSPPVWVAALTAAVDVLTRALRAIERRPDADVVRVRAMQPPGRITRPSTETRRAAERQGLDVPRLPARPARPTLDTPAHRWLADQIGRAEHRLRALARAEAGRRPSARRDALVVEITDLAAHLGALSRRTPLAASGGRPPVVPPLVLRRRSGYAAAFDALRQLERGLDLREGALDVATQDLAVVYETWATLAIVDAVAEVLGTEAPARPFGVDVLGVDVRLRRGRRHAVRLSGTTPQGGAVHVEIVASPRFPAPPALLAQRPDVLVTVRRDEGRVRAVLDAKYRRDDSAGYLRRYGAAGPPDDALGTLHRYRDAIPDGPDLAVALFPGTPDEAFRQSRLWTSIEALGVGAVPLRPGQPGALVAFIAWLVGSRPGPQWPPAPPGRSRARPRPS